MSNWTDVEENGETVTYGTKDHYSIHLTAMEGGGYVLTLYKGDEELDCVADSDLDGFENQVSYWKAHYCFTFAEVNQ